MAVLNLSVTIPDAELPRVQTAARDMFNDPAMTNGQIQEALRQEVISMIKGMVRRFERKVAVLAAEDGTYNVDAT